MRVAPQNSERSTELTSNKSEVKRQASGTFKLETEGCCNRSLRLSSRVLSLPIQVHGKLLCEGTELNPCDETGDVVKLHVERKKNRFCTRKGNVSIKTVEGEPYAGGVSIFDYRRPCSKNGAFVIKDGTGSSIVFCQQSQSKGNARAYDIYGRQPLLDDQDATSKKSFKFYPWYRIESYNMGPFENRAISVWNGTGYEPLLKLKVMNATADKIAISSIVPSNRKIDTKADQKTAEALDYAILQKTTKGWDVMIAPGADPALMLCATLIMDDFVGCFA